MEDEPQFRECAPHQLVDSGTAGQARDGLVEPQVRGAHVKPLAGRRIGLGGVDGIADGLPGRRVGRASQPGGAALDQASQRVVLKSWTRRMNKDEAHLGRTVAVSEAEKTKYVLVDDKNGRRRAAPVHACCPAEAVNRTP